MGKPLLLIFLFVCKSWFCIGNYLEYHKRIIRAERLFLRDSIKYSLIEYETIFKEYRPFAKDAVIALQLSCMTKDSVYANTFFHYCFVTGVNWKIFKSLTYVNNFLNSDSIRTQRLYQQYLEERKQYKATIDTSLRRKMYQLTRDDDDAKKIANTVRNRYFEWLSKQNDSFQITYDKVLDQQPILRNYREKKKDSSSAMYLQMKKVFKKWYYPKTKEDTQHVAVMERNVLVLDSISKKLGYVPGERTIGILDNEYSSDTSGNYLSLRMVSNVVQTFYHHGCAFWMMKDQLWESVKRGEIHPRYYAILYENSYCNLSDKSYDMSSTNSFALHKIKCETPHKDKTYNLLHIMGCPRYKESTALINKYRKELSIASIEHDRQKEEFEKRYKLKLVFGLLMSEM